MIPNERLTTDKQLIAGGAFVAFANGCCFGLTPRGVISVPATFFYGTALVKTSMEILSHKQMALSKRIKAVALVIIFSVGNWLALVFLVSPLIKKSPLLGSVIMFSWGSLSLYLSARRMDLKSYSDPKSNNKTIADMQMITGLAFCASSIALLALRIFKLF